MNPQIINEDVEYIYGKLTEQEKQKLKGSSILITGGSGFLGYTILQFLLKCSGKLEIKNIMVLDNFMFGIPKWIKDMQNSGNVSIQNFDIIKDDIATVENACNADYIIHMASIASPVYYRKYPIETLDANIWGLRRLFEYYKNRKIKGFLFFSSSEIYGNPDTKNIPTKEDYNGNVSATGPRACYDESKRFGETMCRLFAEKYNMPIGVARPFNNYGPGMRLTDKRVPADFANAVCNGNDISILSSGQPTRTFCYVADAVAGYMKVLVYGKYDYFNIGIESPEITIKELAEIYVETAQKNFGYKGRIIYEKSKDTEYLTDNPNRRCPDISKAKNMLGYNPCIGIKDGVFRFLKSIKENEGQAL